MLTQAQNILDYNIFYDVSFCLLHKTRHKIFTIPSRTSVVLKVDETRLYPELFPMKEEVLHGFTTIPHGF